MPAGAIVAGSVIGGVISTVASSNAAGKAAKASQAATDMSISESRRQYDQTRKDLAPYRNLGTDAINDLSEGGDFGALEAIGELEGVSEYIAQLEGLEFEFDPDDELYQWRQSENERQVNQFMASRGGYDSRAAANMLLDSGMSLQSNEIDRQYQMRYLDKYNKLVDLANLKSGNATNKFNMAQGYTNTLLNKVNVGGNAAAQTAQAGAASTNQIVNALMNNSTNQQDAILQRGSAVAGLGQAIGEAPLNYMLAQKLLA